MKTLSTIKRRMLAIVFAAILAMGAFGGAMAFGAAGAIGDEWLHGNAIPPDYTNPNSSVDLSPTPQENIWVTLVVEAGDVVEDFAAVEGTAFRIVVPNISLGDLTTESLYTVTDVLVKADVISSELQFKDANGNPLTDKSNYLAEVDYTTASGTNAWTDGQVGYDGWVFRKDDQFPLFKTDSTEHYQGTSILQTYVSNGDVIHLFYDLPSGLDEELDDVAANYIRAKYISDTGSTLTVGLQGHKTYIGPGANPDFDVYNYLDFATAGVAVELWQGDGGGRAPLATATTNANGQATFSYTVGPGETYFVRSASELRDLSDTDWDFLTDAYFLYTGAYSKIVIPQP
jgi:hypothetical protein